MSSSDDITSIKLQDNQKEIIQKNLDRDGRLPCIKAFAVARKIGHRVEDMSAITKSMKIRISDCALGVFGNLAFLEKDNTIYKELQAAYGGEKKLRCSVYWEKAKEYTLQKVGATVKNSDFEVTYCQLGCFEEKKGKKNGS